MTQEQTQETENQAFEALLNKYGAFELERRIQRMDSARKYYRSLPFEGWKERTGMEAVDLASQSNPLAEVSSDETRRELYSVLTPLERWVAEQTEKGLKPRDMAAMNGRETSNNYRWLLWSIRQKFKQKLLELGRDLPPGLKA